MFDDDFMPVLPSIRDISKMDIVVNDTGMLYLFHREELPTTPEWAEYDTDQASLYFVSNDGQMQDCGVKIHEPMKVYMVKSTSIYLIKVETDGSTKKISKIPVIVR